LQDEIIYIIFVLFKLVIALHEKGMYHNDIKPANIILKQSGLGEFIIINIKKKKKTKKKKNYKEFFF